MIHSLRLRLAVGAIVAIVIALALVWFVLGELLEDNIADSYVNEMTAVTDALAARLATDGNMMSLATEPSDARFRTPAGGRYWQISADEDTPPLRSRSLWDLQLSQKGLSKELYCGFRQAEGPDGATILIMTRTISITRANGSRQFTIYTAFSKAEMEQALEGYQRPLRLMLLATGAILLLAAFLQGAVGLRPLTTLRREIAGIRTGMSPRMQAEGPSELRPLVNELNLLLSERETAVEHARARASDLAHGLKTPLTVLSNLVEALPKEKRDTALKQIDLVRQRADRQLQATRMGAERMSTTGLRYICDRLISALSPVIGQKGIDCRLDIDPELTIQADPADVAEALGNILDNAVRFARRRIQLTAAKDCDMIAVHIGDDGPGAPPRNYAAMLKRGVGNDEADSTGLGLAISGDIAKAYGGQLRLARSALGGLEAILCLPAQSTGAGSTEIASLEPPVKTRAVMSAKNWP